MADPYAFDGTPGTDTNTLKNNTLYDYENPGFALRNAMRDMGINAYANNPFVQTFQRAAPGLAYAFLGRQSAQGNALGPAHGADSGTYFRDFLRQNIGSQSVYSTLKNTAGNAYQMAQDVRQHRNALNSGTTMDKLNPFTAALSDLMGANGGRGTVDLLSSIYGSTMNPGLAAAASRAAAANYEGAVRRLGDQGIGTSNDIFTYLFGI